MKNSAKIDTDIISIFSHTEEIPQNIAIECGNQNISYIELGRLSDSLAHKIVAQGIKPGQLIGITTERSIETIIGLLAILKVGCGYVPLPDYYPEERLKDIAAQAQLPLILGHLPKINTQNIPNLPYSLDSLQESTEPFTAPDITPDSVAYVMFTSGSTGTPKGVVVPHRAILRLVCDQNFMDLENEQRILQHSPIAFDASTLEIWGALLNGGTLVIPEQQDLSLRGLGETIRAKDISTLWLTAGLFHAMADERPEDFQPLQQLLTGGDIVSPSKVAKVKSACPELTIINGYGPTENTTFTCCHTIVQADLDQQQALPIGTPINGTDVYILNDKLEPVTAGNEGELCTTGQGLALGYLGQEALTQAVFVPAPWDASVLLYRTGDLVKQDENDVIHYIGRIDTQVKIRGFRIELGEIETAIEAFPDITQAALVAKPGADGTDKRLYAFYVASNKIGHQALWTHLKQSLPDYSVPSVLQAVDILPLNSNGKVDKKALINNYDADVKKQITSSTESLDVGSLERSISQHLATLLDVTSVDTTTNFFDLGASSLHIARLHERLEKTLKNTIRITDFFLYSTIKTLAAHLSSPVQTDQKSSDQKSTSVNSDTDHIAIIGMAGRFPGAANVDEFWQALIDGKELISRYSDEELEFNPADKDSDGQYVNARGIIDDAELFDAQHFGIPPKEAEKMDPQHRLLLEVAQTALDDAGYSAQNYAGKIGIFAGSSQNSYLLNNVVSAPGAARALAAGYPVKDFATLFGNDKDFNITRIAYKLNLRGPAINVQCACSTSLVAVAQACESLRRGTSDIVLAGGISITFPQKRAYLYTPDGMASADGHCKAFDKDATGTVFGDGAGLVVLKRLHDAIADGDDIVAVIRGHSINNDGADKIGYAAPSIKAQTEVIKAAHKAADVDPRTIGYVEAHGTGTPLGDPIEFAALHDAFSSKNKDYQFCALGTAKTNVGHLDIAAGVTGLIKTALTLKHKIIPPLLHYKTANPNIDFTSSAFYPVDHLTPWASDGQKPRRAGVSAFGVGGTNIHMVLEEAPAAETSTPQTARNTKAIEGAQVFPLSASSESALHAMLNDLGQWAAQHTQAETRDLLHTLRHHRRDYNVRTVVVAESMQTFVEKVGEKNLPLAKVQSCAKIVMLLPGQGSQHVGMAKQLYQQETVFHEALDLCASLLKPELDLNILDVIHAAEDQQEAMTEVLKDTRIAQPAIFSIEYALAKQWAHWGIQPDILVGHSIGELTSACIAGVIKLSDALQLIALRGKLMSDLPGGTMISVRATEAEIMPYLGNGMDLAAVNGTKACVVAGPEEASQLLEASLHKADIVYSRLHTSHAFHSHMMEPIIERFYQAVEKITLSAPTIPIYSTVKSEWLSDQDATDPHYWANHMRKPVRFYDGLQYLWEHEPNSIILEVGPGKTLSTLAAQNPDRKKASPCLTSLPHAKDAGNNDHHKILEAFGLLWANGYTVNWDLLSLADDNIAPGRCVKLPPYPFQRQRFWIEPVDADTVTSAIDSEATTEKSTDTDLSTADAVKAMLSDLSGFDPKSMEEDVSFMELGFDSLLLTQAIKELSMRFGIAVSLRELIDGYDTVSALADHIDQNGHVSGSGLTKLAASTDAKDVNQAKNTSPPSSAPIERHDPAQELDPAQRAHIDRLVKRYNAKTPQSKALTDQYRQYHADPRTASGFNRLWKEMVYQIVTVKSKGSRLVDIDGNEYIDILNGFGPGFLGYGAEPIITALHEQVDTGFEVGPQSLLAMEAAQLFCEVTGNERVSFVCTGSEAVYAAMRLARTCTSRDKIVMFARDYHGNFDEVLVRGIQSADGHRTMPLAPGIPRDAVKNVIVLPYGTPQSLDYIRQNADQLAAVMVEPVQSRRPEFQPFEFVRAVREITRQAGALLIFDEVVTGFRFGPRGAQEFYGVDADLVTYGKVIGGGMPLGVVAGKSEYMDTFDGGHWQFGDDSFPQAPVTFFAGTFVRHPLVIASLKAMLTFFKSQPPHFFKAVNAKGDKLAGTINRWFAENDMPFELPNCGSLMYMRIPEEQKYGALLGAHLRDRGVYFLEGFPSYMTAAHDDEDIHYVVEAIKDSALEMRADNMITGREPVAYKGPKHQAVPPRLALPDGIQTIEKSMREPLLPPSLPMTEAQKEIWLAVKLGDNLANLAYNECISLRFSKALNTEYLAEAVSHVLERHESLKLRFADNDGEHMQFVDSANIAVTVRDLNSLNENSAAMLKAIIADEMQTPFDLEQGPLARATLCRLPQQATELVLTIHHIVCDGWSFGILLNEFVAFYNAKITHQEPKLLPPDSYEKYALDEYKSTRQRDINYWLNVHEPMSAVLDLPGDGLRAPQRTFAAQRIDTIIDEKTTTALRALAKQQKVSFFALVYSIFCVYVARLCQREDVVVGVPYAGQLASGMNRLVGHCVQILPFRVQPQKDQLFLDFLKAVNLQLLEGFDHPQVTMSSLLSAMSIPRDPSRIPLIPITFNLDQPINDLRFDQQSAEFVSHRRLAEPFELAFNLEDRGEDLCAQWSFNSQLYSAPLMNYRMSAFLEMLQALIHSPASALSDLPIVSNAEQQAMLKWNNTHKDMSDLMPVTAQLLQTAEQYSDHIGIVYNDKKMTYENIVTRVKNIVNSIQQLAIEPGSAIAIQVYRSEDLPLTMMAVMMSGCAYVPLDAKQPVNRLVDILDDANVAGIISDHPLPEEYKAYRQKWIDLRNLPTVSVAVNFPSIDLESIAYIIYTSGSTGKPKGVAVKHRGLANIIRSFQQQPGFAREDHLLAVTTAAFDIAGLEFFLPLATGATLVIAPEDSVRDPQYLNQLLHLHNITVLQCVPTTWQLLLSYGGDLPKKLRGWCGGEALPPALISKLPEGMIFWNVYGPTETTIWSTIYNIQDKGLLKDKPVPIGQPIDNTNVYILDHNGKTVPVGVPGTLWIGGAGVASHYHNRSELTAECFKPNHLSNNALASRLYDTGDLVRLSAEGNLEYLGRKDFQVKVRGFRIELGEIESILLSHNTITACVVHAIKNEAGNDYLAAYFEASDISISDSDLRQWLAISLPDYMIPSHFILLDALPLNTNGKVDRGQLPKPTQIKNIAPLSSNDFASPKNDLEVVIVNLFKQFLNVNVISTQINFFEHGGDSLSAVKLIVQLNQDLDIDLPLAILLSQPTPKMLANTIIKDRKVVSLHSVIPLSYHEEGIPIFCLMGIQVYAELAKSLGKNYSVYALLGKSENDFLKGILNKNERSAVIDIQALADEYTQLILNSNIPGPYRLLGFSSGGVVAIEVARRLQQEGFDVELVGLLDTLLPSGIRESSLRKILTQVKKIFSLGKKLTDYKHSQQQKNNPALPNKKIYDDDLLMQRGELLWKAVEKWDTRKNHYNGKVALFHATDLSDMGDIIIIDRSLGWSSIVQEPLTTFDIPSNHAELLTSKNARLIARYLQDILKPTIEKSDEPPTL